MPIYGSRIKLATGGRTERRCLESHLYNARLLKPAVTNNPNQFPNHEPSRPDPVFPEDDEYEIERILDHRDIGNRREYLVHWLGYPVSDDTWVKEDDIHAPELLAEYIAELQREERPPYGDRTRERRG